MKKATQKKKPNQRDSVAKKNLTNEILRATLQIKLQVNCIILIKNSKGFLAKISIQIYRIYSRNWKQMNRMQDLMPNRLNMIASSTHGEKTLLLVTLFGIHQQHGYSWKRTWQLLRTSSRRIFGWVDLNTRSFHSQFSVVMSMAWSGSPKQAHIGSRSRNQRRKNECIALNIPILK